MICFLLRSGCSLVSVFGRVLPFVLPSVRGLVLFSVVELLDESQDRILGFILSLIPDKTAALDILQETNIVIWRKRGEFKDGSFLAWAFRIAKLQTMAHLRDRNRERLVFNPSLVQQLEQAQLAAGDLSTQRQEFLQSCMDQLSHAHRELIESRYRNGISVQDLGVKMKRSAGSISQTLYRLRNRLSDCVARKLEASDG